MVLAHLNGAGMGRKHENIHGAYCCSNCHDVIDHRVGTLLASTDIQIWFFEAIIRTQQIMINEGILKL